jgi:aminoglycoside 6-adenylyltransferase
VPGDGHQDACPRAHLVLAGSRADATADRCGLDSVVRQARDPLRTPSQVLAQISGWAQRDELVRAVILTSTRASPDPQTDILSDYDVELYVASVEPFLHSDAWLDQFGSVLVRWPFRPRPGGPGVDVTRLVIFNDGVRIDFTIHQATAVATDAYGDDYRVLVDKDGLLGQLLPPSHTKHLVRKPTRDQFETLVNEFWWDAHYVPKCLRRDELPFAAAMLSQSVRGEYLHTLIEWYIGALNEWTVNTGVCGRRFRRYLDDQTWQDYESTFARAAVEEHWVAFFNAVGLFRRLGRAVAERLGYSYPDRIDRQMSEYYEWIRSRDTLCEVARRDPVHCVQGVTAGVAGAGAPDR